MSSTNWLIIAAALLAMILLTLISVINDKRKENIVPVTPTETPIPQPSPTLLTIGSPTPALPSNEVPWGVSVEIDFDYLDSDTEDEWKTAINADWRNPRRSNSRYHVVFEEEIGKGETCTYGFHGLVLDLRTLQVYPSTVITTIIDKITGETLAKKTFESTGSCPDNWRFNFGSRFETIYLEPDVSKFESWINDQLASYENTLEATALPPTPVPPLPPSALEGKTILSGYAYTAPNPDASRLKSLQERLHLTVIILGQSEDQQWYFVRFRDGVEGWVKTTNVEIIGPVD